MTDSVDPAPRPPADPTGPVPVRQRTDDRSRWYWLLLLPIVIPLLTFLYNGEEPRLFGFPRFYWLQLLFIVLGVGTTTLVHQMTKRRG